VNDDQVWLNPAAVALDVEVEKDADAEIKK
jgi:hypothetical protein